MCFVRVVFRIEYLSWTYAFISGYVALLPVVLLEYVRSALSVGACDDVAFVDIALTANILVIIVSINTIDTNLFVLPIGITAFLFISCYLSGVFAPCLLYYVIFLC